MSQMIANEESVRIKPQDHEWTNIKPEDILAKLPPDDPALSQKNKVLEVKMLWGDIVMDVLHFAQGSSVTVGEDTKSNFSLSTDTISGAEFKLADFSSVLASMYATADMPLTIKRSEEIHNFEQAKEKKLLDQQDGQYSFELEIGDIAIVKVGDVNFVLRYVTPAQAYPKSIWDNFDYYFWTIWTLSFIAHMFIIIAFHITDRNVDYLTEDLF